MQDDRSSPRAPRQDWNSDLVAYDGRDAVGFVRKFADIYAAYDAAGKLLGRFHSQSEALRAIPTGRRQP